MNRIFYSKVDWTYFVAIAVIGAFMIYFFWIKAIWLAALFAVITILLIKRLTHTRYIITQDDLLRIESGKPFPTMKIPIADILSVRHSHSLVSLSPALSIDQIEICFRSKSSKSYLLLSPKNKEEMVEVLKKRNASIIVNLK